MKFQRINLFDLSSLGIILGGLVAIYVVVPLDANAQNLINNVGFVGSVFSIAGSLIAIIQIYKVSSNAKTYERTFKRTIGEIKNNEFISTLARANQHVVLIKMLLEHKKVKETRPNFNQLLVDLSLIKNINVDGFDKIATGFIDFISKVESDTFMQEDKIEDQNLKIIYEQLTQMQVALIEIEASLKTPKRDENYGE